MMYAKQILRLIPVFACVLLLPYPASVSSASAPDIPPDSYEEGAPSGAEGHTDDHMEDAESGHLTGGSPSQDEASGDGLSEDRPPDDGLPDGAQPGDEPPGDGSLEDEPLENELPEDEPLEDEPLPGDSLPEPLLDIRAEEEETLFFEKDFSSYTVTEGLLLLTFLVVFCKFCIDMTAKVMNWRMY